MMWYLIYLIATGERVSDSVREQNDSALAARGLAQKEFDYNFRQPGYTWNPSTLDFDYVQPPAVELSHRKVFELFTITELADMHSVLNSTQTRDQGAAYMTLIYGEESVSVSAWYFVDFCDLLVTEGAITQRRRDEIINGVQ